MAGRVATALFVVVLLVPGWAGIVRAEAPASGAPAGSAAAALHAAMVEAGAAQEVEGRFLQTRRSPLLVEPLVSAGAFRLRAPDYARWVVENPEAIVLEVDGGRIRAGRPGALREVPDPGAAGALRAMLALFLGGRTAELEQFEVEAGEGAGAFRLRPRRGTLPGIEHMSVTLAEGGGGPQQLVLHETDGGTMEIRLLDVAVRRGAAERTEP